MDSEHSRQHVSTLIGTLSKLSTESRDPSLDNYDSMSIVERCKIQNRFDIEVACAVEHELQNIADAVAIISSAFKSNGHLFYVGAGTSGRLGVLDASECPPTFGTDPRMVQGIIAGGNIALTTAVEGIEDDFDAGRELIREYGITDVDVVVGITASGRTPFVLGALTQANKIGAKSIGVTNNRPTEIETLCVGPCIAAIVGPEIVAGSSRLKAGTAQKLILNMLTTQSMIEIGKTYGTAMVDVQATNSKLKARALRMVMQITGVDQAKAESALSDANGSVKVAIVMISKRLDANSAASLLNEFNHNLRDVLEGYF